MEEEKRSTVSLGKEADVQCPICGAPTIICADRSSEDVALVFAMIHRTLYHTRTCQGCYFSFSALKMGELLWTRLEPYVSGFLPRRRRLFRSIQSDLPIHVPSRSARAPKKTPQPTQRGASAPTVTKTQIPFSVDPIKRTVSINLECSIGEGAFGDQIMAAASSLESNLREAADQIRSLVECHPSGEQNRSTDLEPSCPSTCAGPAQNEDQESLVTRSK